MLQFNLLGTELHICQKFGLIYEHRVFYEGAVLEICDQESCAISFVSIENLLGLPFCLILLLQTWQTIEREWLCQRIWYTIALGLQDCQVQYKFRHFAQMRKMPSLYPRAHTLSVCIISILMLQIIMKARWFCILSYP